MTFEDLGDGRRVVPTNETPVPHEANNLAPGAISELDARASFDKLMDLAAKRIYGSGASYVQGVIMAFEELGWVTELWWDDD